MSLISAVAASRPVQTMARGSAWTAYSACRNRTYASSRGRRRAAAGLKKARDPSLAAKRERILEVIACLEEKKGEWERAVAAGR